MSNKIRARNRQAFDFQDGLKVRGVDIDTGGGSGNVVTTVAGRIGDVILTRADVGLGNVDNTDVATILSLASLDASNKVNAAVIGNGGGAGVLGGIVYVAGTTAPVGYLKANGDLVSRTIYADLFAYIGTTYGAGDGSTTFALPDLRGVFPRGLDDGKGIDIGRVLGSEQLDAFQGHYHKPLTASGFSTSNSTSGTQQSSAIGGIESTTGGAVTDTVNGVPRTASETRPRNVALLACICCVSSSAPVAPVVATYTYTVPTGTTYDLNIHAAAIAAGWNNTDKLIVNIPTGVNLYASATSEYACVVNGGYTNGLEINNAGNIIGRGGLGGAGGGVGSGYIPYQGSPGAPGGPALYLASNCILKNTGIIGGGGGGGPGGGAVQYSSLPNEVATPGGDGGNGAGSNGNATIGATPQAPGQIGGTGGGIGQVGIVGANQYGGYGIMATPGAGAVGGSGASIVGASYILPTSVLGTTLGSIIQ